MERVLITGAAGRIGRMLRERLSGYELRLLDVEPVPGGIAASVTDLEAMVEACAGVDAVVHLGGISGEASWERIRDTNIEGTYCVFEAARRAGVRRVVYASSNHAVGFVPTAPDLPDDLPPRPDTFYGVSKVLGEALGALYHDRHGMDVVCLRIGSCFDEPHDLRGLATWLSPNDCARLVEAALTCEEPGFRTVWGISANTRRVWSLEGGAAIGYHPVDDAEVYAAGLTAGPPEREEAGRRFVGGAFTL
ncbi:NAD-dependent epimerase/dehydratase family protein [Pseudonocardia pini]|uniref:NAD-dependent epimerase/dehydratase family protein n=1 Tax=Pseudonocardia pini TaxID=2758030 RepID=UPI0015F0ED03|nr:NAD(P)-dependent oxidoreductase [Pseudonocardia pini]